MPTVAEAIETYLKVNRSPSTQRQYGYVLRRFAHDIGPARDVRLVTYEDLLDFLDQRRRQLSQSSLASQSQCIRGFFAWCVRRRYLDVNPAADVVIRHRRQYANRAVPADELARMLDCARLTSPRNFALLMFLADTGCRAIGACSLRLPHLHVQDRLAELIEKGDKRVVVYFGDATAAALTAWLLARPPAPHDFVWTGKAPSYKPIGRTGLYAIIRQLARRTGASEHCHPHAIRHAVGHALARAGVSPKVTQRKLNHSNVLTTLEYYYPNYDQAIIDEIRAHPLPALGDTQAPAAPPSPRLVKRA